VEDIVMPRPRWSQDRAASLLVVEPREVVASTRLSFGQVRPLVHAEGNTRLRVSLLTYTNSLSERLRRTLSSRVGTVHYVVVPQRVLLRWVDVLLHGTRTCPALEPLPEAKIALVAELTTYRSLEVWVPHRLGQSERTCSLSLRTVEKIPHRRLRLLGKT